MRRPGASAPPHRPETQPPALGAIRGGDSLSIGLSAVIVAASVQEPRVLTIRLPAGRAPGDPGGDGEAVAVEALPSGPLEAEHRTLEIGLRSWVERQTSQRLGYVEQLYTFGDRGRSAGDGALALPALVVAYLALVREARPAGSAEAEWRNWYRYFPWEDWRDGRPALLDPIETALTRWTRRESGEAERRLREERVGLAFGLSGAAWNEELVLERYELLYQAGLVSEAARDLGRPAAGPDDVAAGYLATEYLATGAEMAVDHRRILATAIGRLRGKIKYRPVVFELMPPAFTLLQLQRTVEALSGVRLHKQNFRRLVEQQGLVEETGEISARTGGRPARLVRFRREVLLERPAPGLRLRPAARRGLSP
ncbi:MAG: hypothetical protein AB7H90_15390 [Alphaproteobacteria bacterium]